MTDAAGSTSTTQITVTIQGANDAPTAVADTATAIEAGGVSNGTAGTNPTGNVLTNDTDPDSVGNGETKTITGVLAGTQASATGNVASSVTGTLWLDQYRCEWCLHVYTSITRTRLCNVAY